MILTLGSKIATLFSVGLALVTVILISVFANEVNRRYRELYIERGQHTVNELQLKTEKLLELGLYPEELMGYEKLLQDTLSKTDGVIYLAFLGSDGSPYFETGSTANLPIYSLGFEVNPAPILTHNEFVVHSSIADRYLQGGIIVAILDEDLSNQKTNDFVKATLIYALSASLAAILLVLLYLRSNLGRPLKQLVARIHRVESGEVNKHTDLLEKRGDEIGVVARAFEAMLSRLSLNQAHLAKSNEELKRLTHELENRVDERTRELEGLNKKLKSLAHLDVLTGLYNRHCLEEVLETRFENARRNGRLFALLMVDLDKFKDINDRYGHLAGDETLSVIGKRIRNALRYEDCVFRFGGDEFVFIFEGYPNPETLITIVEKIVKVVVQPVEFEGQELNFGMSIGVASSKYCSHCSAEQLLVHADNAMYEAKQKNRDYVISNECTL